MPTTSKPAPTPPNDYQARIQSGVKARQEQLAGKVLDPVAPVTVKVGNTTTTLTGRSGPPQDPFNRRGGQPELPPPTGYTPQADSLDQLPNWDKLTGFERSIMRALPGQKGGLAEAYAKWDSEHGNYGAAVLGTLGSVATAAGGIDAALGGIPSKLLGAFDAGAEFTERSTGMLQQALEGGGFGSDLKAAWYASSLTADSYDFWKHSAADEVLGGTAVLVQSRQKIAQLVSQGATYHDALAITRDEYLASLGALALRSQMNDLGWHLIVDPINILLSEIKPIERTQALRRLLLGVTASSGAVAEITKDAETAAEVLKTADRLNEEAQAAVKLAEATGDATKLAEATATAQETAQKAYQAAQEATTKATLLRNAQFKGLSPNQERLMRLFGFGDAERGVANIIKLTGGELGGKVMTFGDALKAKDWGALLNAVNPFALTPSARAHELLNIFQTYVGTHLIAANRTVEGGIDVEGFVRGFQRLIDGAYAPELGNMVLSIEGRTLKAGVAGFGSQLNDLYASYKSMQKFETPLLKLLADTLETTPHDIIRRLAKGEIPAVLNQFLEKAGKNPDLVAAVKGLLASENLKELTPDVLTRLSHVLGGKEFSGYTDDLFLAEVQNALYKHVEEQAVAQFGIKAKGLLRQVSDTMKSAEALIYLRANPAYPVKNFINNNITLLARGVFGNKLDVSAGSFLARYGFLPPRFAEGFGIEGADVIGRAVQDTGGKIIQPGSTIANAENGEGVLQKVRQWIKGIPVPKAFDGGNWARAGEAQASARATYTVFERYFPDAYHALLGNPLDFAPDAFKGMPRELLDQIRHAVTGADSELKLDALLSSQHIPVSFESIVAAAERKSGMPLKQILDWSEVRPFGDALAEAVKSGSEDAIRAAERQLNDAVQGHIDKLIDDAIETMRDEAAAKVSAEGPGAFGRVWADAMDEWWHGHERHMMNMEEALGKIKAGAKDDAYQLWKETTDNARAYWDRQWTRMEARFQGFIDKATELGLPGVPEIQGQLAEWRKGWTEFFAKRDSLWGEYWTARKAGTTPPMLAEDIKAALQDGYAKMIDNEFRHQAAIDARMAAMLPEEQRPLFEAGRNAINEWRRADKEAVAAFRQKLEGLKPDQIERAWQAHNAERVKRWNIIRQKEQAHLAAMLGSQPAQEHFAEGTARFAVEGPVLRQNRDVLYQAASANGISTATAAGKPNDRHLIAALNKYLPDGAEKFTREELAIGLTPERLAQAQAALEARAGSGTVDVAADATKLAEQMALNPPTPPTNVPTLPDIERIIKPELYVGTGLDQHWYMRGRQGVRSLADSAVDIMRQPRTQWSSLSEEAQTAMRGYIEHAKGALKDARYHASRMAEWGRDSALLNYSRRMNYNNWLGVMMPFEFWSTQSAWKWAIHSIDHPGMTAAYLRMSKFLDTAYRPSEGLPTRLKGKIRVAIPFMPKWMGNEVFFDPLQIALPFNNWMQPFEQMDAQNASDMGQAERKLEEMLNGSEITQAEYQDATTHQGPVWERALALARQDDSEGRMNGLDLLTSVLPPHLPILYALDAARGRNPAEERGPILPMTRSLGNVLSVLGVDPSGPLNPEANIRKGLGLHPFSKWDDYLTERMLTNMVATGDLSLDVAKRAMIEHTGPAWDEALKRAGIERAGGNGITAALGLAGIPLKPYPPGEEANRALQDDYKRAWDAYDKSGGDYKNTVGAWLKDHPGYEARLALFKKPEERLHQFLTDEFWDTWSNLPTLTRNQLQDQLGPEFSAAMFDKATGWGQNADPAKLATWLKLMGGNPPGTLAAADGMTVDLAPPDVAQRAQVFYTTRDNQYNGWKPAQDGYYKLLDDIASKYSVEAALVDLQAAGNDKAARQRVFRDNPALSAYYDEKKAATDAYLKAHPLLPAYWDWRDSFLARNNDVAPYLSDKPIYQDRATTVPQFNFSRAEWQNTLGTPLFVLAQYAAAGESLRPQDEADLLARAETLGWQGSLAELVQTITQAR